MSYEIGSYVNYKNVPHMVCDYKDELLMIISSSNNIKLCVKPSRVTPINCPKAVMVTVCLNNAALGAEYLVTKHGRILSMITHKWMQWPVNDSTRLQIIQAAEAYDKPPEPEYEQTEFVSPPMVCKSNAGYYVGRMYADTTMGMSATDYVLPWSRDSDYFATEEKAAKYLASFEA